MSENSTSVVSDYEKVTQSRSKIKKVLSLILLFDIVLFIGLFYSTISNFKNEGIPQLVQEFQSQSKPLVGRLAIDAPKVVQEVLPKFFDKIAADLNKNLPEFEKLINDELGILENYGENIRPEVEKQVANLIDESYAGIKNELKNILGETVTDAQLDKITLNYKIAFEAKFYDLLVNKFGGHLQLAEGIYNSSKKIAEKPEFKNADVDPQQILALGLEVLAKDLQSN